MEQGHSAELSDTEGRDAHRPAPQAPVGADQAGLATIPLNEQGAHHGQPPAGSGGDSSGSDSRAARPGRWQIVLAGLGLLGSGLLLALLATWNPPTSAAAARTPISSTVTVHVLGAPATETPAIPPTATPLALATAQAAQAASLASSKTVVTFSGPLTSSVGLAWSPDNRTLALAGTDHLVRLLDTSTGRVTFLPGHTGAVFMVGWSPDGQTLASGGADGTVRLWDAGGQPRVTLTDTLGLGTFNWATDGTLTTLASGVKILNWRPDGTPVGAYKTGENLYAYLAWSPDGKLLAGATDKTVHLWQPDGTLQTILTDTSIVYCLAWSPDNELLAMGADDGSILVWGSGAAPGGTLTGHTGFVNSLAWSPDGQTLASAAADNTVRLWSRDGVPLATLTGHTAAALGVAWSPDGRSLASVGADNTVRIWR